MAITYNDVSVNENMHAAMLYETLTQDGCEVLETLSKIQEHSVRKMVVTSILGTDMVHHFEQVKKLQTLLKENGSDIRKWESNMTALEAVLHSADISNVSRPFD